MEGNPLRVSICEDDAAQAQFLAQEVRAFAPGARVETFARGEDMLLARGELADILLLDIQMPGMDGVALARELRTRGNQAQIILSPALRTICRRGTMWKRCTTCSSR